jgi:hypothetical protein
MAKKLTLKSMSSIFFLRRNNSSTGQLSNSLDEVPDHDESSEEDGDESSEEY